MGRFFTFRTHALSTMISIVSVASLGAQESSLPVYREAGSIPLIGWVCDSTKGTAEARTISLSAMDFARDSEGSTYLGYDQQFRTWIPRGMGLALLRKEAAPGATAAGASVAKVKCRKGQFWVRDQDHTRVLQWDPKASTWRVALNPGYEFEDFEVSFHGQVVLFGAGPAGKKHFIECFEFNAKDPVSTEPFPSSGLASKEEERCGFSWDLPYTCVSDEFIICYFSMAGRLFVYDTSKHSLREISTPWKPFTAKWYRDQDRDFGAISMNTFPGSRCLQFVPTPSRNSVGIAYQIPGKASRKNVLVDGKQKLVSVGPDKDAEPVRVLELDLTEMKLSPLASDVAPKLPVWLKSDGNYGPLAAVLETSERHAPAVKAAVKNGLRGTGHEGLN